jgi:hypothetical protein
VTAVTVSAGFSDRLVTARTAGMPSRTYVKRKQTHGVDDGDDEMSAARKKFARHFLASGREDGTQGRDGLCLVSPAEALRLTADAAGQWCAVLCGDIWLVNCADAANHRVLVHGWEVESKSRDESWQEFIQRANGFAARMISAVAAESTGAASAPAAVAVSIGIVSEVDHARLRRDRLRELRRHRG